MYQNAETNKNTGKHTTFANIFRRFQKNGDFSCRPRVLAVKAVCQDICLDGICQGQKCCLPTSLVHHTRAQTTQLTATNPGVAGTDAMDARLTGGVNRPAAALAIVASSPPPPPPPPSTTCTSTATRTQRKHNHLNSHQLAPQQQSLGQG